MIDSIDSNVYSAFITLNERIPYYDNDDISLSYIDTNGLELITLAKFVIFDSELDCIDCINGNNEEAQEYILETCVFNIKQLQYSIQHVLEAVNE